MKIQEFNVLYNNRFRYVESPSYEQRGKIVRSFKLEQYCPMAETWCRMLVPGRWNLSFSADERNIPPSDDSLTLDNALIVRIQTYLHGGPRWIIIVEEKHVTRYFGADDTEQIGQACLQLIKERKEFGYFPSDDLKPPEAPPVIQASPDDREAMKLIADREQRYKNQMRQYRSDLELLQLLRRALDNNDYHAAYRILSERNGYEYEGFRIEKLEKASD
jgi:hypothetical protein